MKKYFVALMAFMMLFTMSLGNNVYAESVRDIEHIIFVDDESLINNEDFDENSNITPFAYEWEKKYKDGRIKKAPKGTASKEFKVEVSNTTGDKILGTLRIRSYAY